MRGLVLPASPLTGGGVTLRPWHEGDAESLAFGWNDPEVRRWASVPADAGSEKARDWIAGASQRLKKATAIDLAVLDHRGTVVGEVGLSNFDYSRRAALIGWWLAKQARGRGIATQAVRLLVAWSLEPPLGLDSVLARIHPENDRSLVLAERAGFRVLSVQHGGEVIMLADSGSPVWPKE